MALKLKGIELLSNQQVRTLDLTVAQREEEMEEAEEVPMKGTSASTAANTDIGLTNAEKGLEVDPPAE